MPLHAIDDVDNVNNLAVIELARGRS